MRLPRLSGSTLAQHTPRLSSLLASLASLACLPANAGSGCGFDVHSMQFAGSSLTQSACLLRQVLPWGRIVEPAARAAADPRASPRAPLAPLPASLAAFIGQATQAWMAPLAKLMAQEGLSASQLGGALEQSISHAQQADGRALPARYFVIHDTSWPWLDRLAFPAPEDPALNDLGQYAHPKTALAHVFVARMGQSYTAHDFGQPWRATKLESRVIGPAAKGLFLHVELVQPRQRDPMGPAGNDALAPTPGFTDAQYQRLAWLYMAASVRAGVGLIPALHANIDEGLADGHDDPQGFDVEAFGAALAALQARLRALGAP